MILGLPIPISDDELSLHRVDSCDLESASPHTSHLNGISSLESSLCPHAVSFGSFVRGISQTWKEGDPWLTWKASFAPYRVCRVTSNHDGSIIVCSTDAETVALLRGTDGSVLATRKVPNDEEKSVPLAAHTSFIAREISKESSDLNDAVLIEIPSKGKNAKSNFLLVSDIDSRSLNSTNPLRVAEAARKMTINMLTFKIGSNAMISLCGCFLGSKRIRFISLDNSGNIGCHDYSGPDSPMVTVADSLPWKSFGPKTFYLDHSIGLRIHELRKRTTYVMFATDTEIFFLDPFRLLIAGSCDMSSIFKTAQEGLKILTVEPVESATPDSGLAAAVAVKSKGEEGVMVIIIETAFLNMNLGSFHQVCTVPIKESLMGLSFAACQYSNQGAYSFRFKVGHGSENCACNAFVPTNNIYDGSAIGRIRLLIQSECFDEADIVINSIGESALVADEFACFHPSEVALGRLQQILKVGNVSAKASMAQARQCFHRLASGCISGNERAGQNLLCAAESIAQWTSPGSSSNPPTLMEVTAALSTGAKVFGEVLKMLPPERHALFEEKRNQLEDQLATLRHLTTILPKNSEEKLHFLQRFQGCRNPGELFTHLVANECFPAAEVLWNSHLRRKIYPEVAAKAVVGIRANSDPSVYIGMVEECIIPSLARKFELLPLLWTWSCRLADEMDDHGSLHKAIDLLQSVDRATNELQLRIHWSFASYSPFADRPATTRKAKAATGNRTTPCGDISFFPSLGSSPSTQSISKPAQSMPKINDTSFSFPTVLELGHIKRGASKARVTATAVHALVGCKEAESQDTTDSLVRKKLLDARCLKAARDLGLEKQVAHLRTFSKFGGMLNFAKELVRSLSTMTRTHKERCSVFKTKLSPFCEAFSINFDEAILQYLRGLCTSTMAKAASIQEAASVARCCKSVATKCQCILIVLRAALFCRYAPPWLMELSRGAIALSSSNLSLRSELVEASRLLLIDGIVRKYVGSEGCELFRVDNPRHALRLLDYVTENFDRESVLNDALDLADAFNHLSRQDACAALCNQTVSCGRVALCSDFVEELYVRDSMLAGSTASRIVSFCIELVSECSKGMKMNLPATKIAKLKERALDGSTAACAILSIMFSQSSTIETELLSTNAYARVDLADLKSLKLAFLWINELQRNHSVFFSFSDLRNTTTLLNTAAELMAPIVIVYASGDSNEFNLKLAHAKRACSLLAGASECQEIEFWCGAISMVVSPLKWNFDDNDGLCIDFLVESGVLGGFGAANLLSARAALAVSFGLCLKASKDGGFGLSGFNDDVGRAVSLVHDYCLTACPGNLLIQCQSLSTLTEMVWHVLLRGDAVVGENLETLRRNLLIKSWSSQYQFGESKHFSLPVKLDLMPSSCRMTALHPSWYIGDGLLLPPAESIARSVKFCKDVMNALTVSSRRFVPLASGGISEMTRFLFHHGALSVALCLLSWSSILLLCSGVPKIAHRSLSSAIQEVHTSLVERSLGGTGNGIISQIVDSQHAVSFLLSLPVKLAFKVYKSALPIAISTRDYSRVIALASIGILAGGSGAKNSLQSGWRNQEKLIAQCKRISSQSVWWRFLRKHRISFDQKLLDEGADKSRSPYCQKLLIPIISRLLTMTKKRTGSPVRGILHVLMRYADTFGLQHERIVEAYIEFLLSSPDDETSSDDIRLQLPKVEMSVKELFPLLQPKTKQALILRRCVMRLEQNERSFKDYDRYLAVLQLYRDTLQSFMGMHKAENLDRKLLEREFENVDRRIDSLCILSSVFEGERKSDRPPFPPFFRPLPMEFAEYSDGTSMASCGILGKDDRCKQEEFDPLEPLHGLLLLSHDMGASTALAPLCIPLGIPGGFIHSRFLMEHFRLSAQQGSTLPSFEHDVLPVFARIQTAKDKAALAEWCSKYYIGRGHDKERLSCLELALNWAIKFSNETEQRKNRFSRNAQKPGTLNSVTQDEIKALEAVQRLSRSKSSLSDKISVEASLQKDPALAPIINELLQKLDQTLWVLNLELPPPECVLEALLSESSLIAAKRCLDSVPLSMQQFRKFSLVVNDACEALSEEHSHVQVGRTAWKMVQRWLFQGDAPASDVQTIERKADPASPAFAVKNASKILDIGHCKEEDTINFVMDLSTIQDDEHVLRDETHTKSSKEEHRIIADEEWSAVKNSVGEEAEQITIRTSLRVAFVLACDDNNHHHDHPTESNMGLEEISTSGSHSRPPVRSAGKGKGKGKGEGLLARIEKLGNNKQHSRVMACARDLLKVVFAKSEPQCKAKFSTDDERNVSATVTFSMRHRALRSAAVLVPQEALERVIEEEGYLEACGGISLKMCTFGAFVANECEQIGMPLSHSDLGHISSICFSSYARTLWRHHREGDQKGSKGRLLLLLLQMSLKDEANIDAAFVEVILSEMGRLHLPRSLLLACECIARLREEIGPEEYDLLLSACGSTVNESIAIVAKAVLTEVRDESDTVKSIEDVVGTVSRLGQAIQRFSNSIAGQGQLHHLLQSLRSEPIVRRCIAQAKGLGKPT